MGALEQPDPDVLELARAVAECEGARSKLLRVLVTRPRTAVWTAAWVSRLPDLDLDLPADAGPVARAVREPLERKSFGIPTGRLARAVLELPADGSYRRGRARQALRTNVARAERAGLVVRPLESAQDLSGLADLLLQVGHDRERLIDLTQPSLRPATMLLGCFEGERLLGYSALVVCGRWAWLRSSHCERSARGRDARWLLHADAVDRLVQRGVTRMLVESAIGLPAGLQYFQRLTGFQAVNLRLAPDPIPHGRHMPGR